MKTVAQLMVMYFSILIYICFPMSIWHAMCMCYTSLEELRLEMAEHVCSRTCEMAYKGHE